MCRVAWQTLRGEAVPHVEDTAGLTPLTGGRTIRSGCGLCGSAWLPMTSAAWDGLDHGWKTHRQGAWSNSPGSGLSLRPLRLARPDELPLGQLSLVLDQDMARAAGHP